MNTVASASLVPVGVRYMLLSALGFALMAVCVKAVSLQGIPVLEIVAARSLVSLLISYVDVKRKGISMWGERHALLTARGVVGTVALICVYYSVSTLPLAEATILQYLYPLFTALLALIFLNERIQRATALCLLLSITGLIVIVRPEFLFGGTMALPTLSVGAALVGALGSAIAYVFVRRLSQSEDSSVIILYFPLIALPVSLTLIVMQDAFVMPSLGTLVLLLLVGVFTQVGQVGLTKAMQTEEAGKASAYAYVQVIFSMLLGWICFAEIPTLWTWVGGSLIILGALINLLWKR